MIVAVAGWLLEHEDVLRQISDEVFQEPDVDPGAITSDEFFGAFKQDLARIGLVAYSVQELAHSLGDVPVDIPDK
jgi:hypothetical protein